MRFTIHIRMNSPPVTEAVEPVDDDSDGLSDVESLLEDFTGEISALEPAISQIESQLASISDRMKHEEVEWLDRPLEPRSQEVKAWCDSKGLGAPTLRSWTAAILKSAIVCDGTSRTLRLCPSDAALYSGGSPTIGFFDLLRGVSEWFALPAA